MRRFSLYKRSDRKYYYVQLRNPETGEYLPARSTSVKDPSEAALVVAGWLRDGIPENGSRRAARELFGLDTVLYTIRECDLTPADAKRIVDALHRRGLLRPEETPKTVMHGEPLLPFLRRFWDDEKSEYLREKRAYGQSVGRRHVYESSKRLSHWESFFGDCGLRDVTPEKLRKFQLQLRDSGTAPKTVNLIVDAGKVALNWAAARGLIETNPTAGLRRFSAPPKKRGILTADETRALLSVKWSYEPARIATLVAATTGARSGEVLALQIQDIGTDRLEIRHSFNRQDGLKPPKNGETRTVPLLPEVREELLRLVRKNPYGSAGERFVFYGQTADQPMSSMTLRRCFEQALQDSVLAKNDRKDAEKRRAAREQWRARNVSFHSLRHGFATRLADRVDMRTVQLGTGHKTAVMAEHYAKHAGEEHFQAVSAAVTAVFSDSVK